MYSLTSFAFLFSSFSHSHAHTHWLAMPLSSSLLSLVCWLISRIFYKSPKNVLCLEFFFTDDKMSRIWRRLVIEMIKNSVTCCLHQHSELTSINKGTNRPVLNVRGCTIFCSFFRKNIIADKAPLFSAARRWTHNTDTDTGKESS